MPSPPAPPTFGVSSSPWSADGAATPRVPRPTRLIVERVEQSGRSEAAREAVERDLGQLLGRQLEGRGNVGHLLAERRAGDGPIVGRDRHAHPGSTELGQWMGSQVGDQTSLDVRSGAQVEGDVALAERFDKGRVVGRRGAVGHAPDAEVEHLADPLRAGDLTRVGGERQAGLARGHEGDRVRGSRPLGFGTGEVEADDRRSEGSRAPRHLGVCGWRVLPHGRHDQPDERRTGTEPLDSMHDAGRHGLDDLLDRQATLEVQARCPADLGVPDAIGGEVGHQLVGDTLERWGVLEQRDGQIEEAEELCLVRAALWADHARRRLVQGQWHADRLRQLDRRRRPDRSVEVLVQLCLRQVSKRLEVHPPMIGTRVPLTAVSALAVVIGLGGGAPRPEMELAARAAIVDSAASAETALDPLGARLAAAFDSARAGSARTVEGEAVPGPKFDRAAEEVRAAVDVATDASHARERLAAARAARSPDVAELPPAPDPAELAAIGDQLIATADSADAFAVMRARAESMTPTLLDALGALESGEIEAAEGLVADARDALAVLTEWDVGAPTLPVWLSTMDEMIGAMQRLVVATRAGDAAAAESAADEFAALAEDAPAADRALRIALGEGGSAVSAPVLERLGAILAATDALRLAVVAAREAVGG